MAGSTNISWTDHTFNPWIGCQKVSPGCDHCYAETWSQRYGWTGWGPGAPRRRTGPAAWRQPLAWNRRAQSENRPHRVFCASLADVFDLQAPSQARNDLWDLIRETPWLHWQLLTKRPQHFSRLLPAAFPQDYSHVWLGVSAENQAEYDRRWPWLAEQPASVRFVSYEPALGPLTLRGHPGKPDWLIWGGESGPGARPAEPGWIRAVAAECQELALPVFGKQWGRYEHHPHCREQGESIAQARAADPPENGKGGAQLDGRLLRQWPTPTLRTKLRS